MPRLVRFALLILFSGLLTLPALATAGNMANGDGKEPLSSVNESTSSALTVPQAQTVTTPGYTDISPPGGQAALNGDNAGQESGSTQGAGKDHIKVVYDPDTEKDRGVNMMLVIAFGVSLALNIFLGTSLFASRR